MSGLAINRIGGPSMFASMSGFEGVSTQSASGGASGIDNPLVDNMGNNGGITGSLTNISQLITNLLGGINNNFAGMSNALLGGGGDMNQFILNNTRLRAALGYARTFWQMWIQELDEEKKALASQKSLGTAAA